MTHPPTLLVLSPSTGGYYFGALLLGLTREVAAAGGRIVLVQTLEQGMRSDAIGEPPDFDVPVHRERIDGAVAITSAVRAEYLRALQADGIPVVLASNRLDGLDAPAAVPDNRGGTAAAVEHLLGHGHTRVGFVGNLAQRDIRERRAAWRSTLEAHGLPCGPDLVLRAGDNSDLGGTEAARAFLAAPDRPTAVMIATDRNAVGFMAVVTAAGLRVPEDVAVVGFDNIEGAAFSTPTLTTVDQPFPEVGALAARLVLAQVAGERVPHVPHISPASVVVRRSCGCAPAVRRQGVDQEHPAGRDVVVAPRPAAAREPREALVERLSRRLLTGDAPLDTLSRRRVREVLAEIERLAALGPDVHPAQTEPLTAAVRLLTHRPRALRLVTRALAEHARRADVAEAVVTALWHVEASSFLSESATFELRLDEQLGVDGGLLDSDRSDPRDLSWLRDTHVVGGVLGLWEAPADDAADDVHGAAPGRGTAPDRTLRLVGVHDPTGAVPGVHGTSVPATRFPPPGLVDLAHPEQRRICFVVPVRSRARDWGMLALVAEIETTSAHETFHHWAALLAATLDARGLQDAVHRSEERYAAAARAAKDGLWDWSVGERDLYLSDRCRELLGLGADEVTRAGTWLRHVVPEDVPLVSRALARARSEAGVPVELELRVLAPDGTHHWRLSRCLGVGPAGGPVERLVGSLSDIGVRKALEEQLRQGALYDTVTGLPNRRLFLDRLTAAVEQRRRRGGARFAVVFLDLDGFKLINDSLGHLVGDELLRVVAERLRDELRAVDTAARFGGDEFAVLLSDPVPDEVLLIARRIQERIAAPVVLDGQEVSVTASVGIATSETEYTDPEHVLRDADTAMYHSKGVERGSASVFDPEMHLRATGRLQARGELRTALAESQFVVHYQPIVAFDGTGLDRFEALVRWEHPERGLLLPGAFLPAMEDNATIVTLGHWLIDEVCRQVAEWRTTYSGDVAVSVNLSHREFWSDALQRTVARALRRHGVPAECLVIEITESVIMADADAARRVMGDLQDLGLKLHIDDFGTGQSSLNALRTLPVDALKIDGSFVRELVEADRTRKLVGVILHMGRALGIDVIAECVESQEQAGLLSAMGCQSAQGWLYARALSGVEAGALLGRPLAAPAPQLARHDGTVEHAGQVGQAGQAEQAGQAAEQAGQAAEPAAVAQGAPGGIGQGR